MISLHRDGFHRTAPTTALDVALPRIGEPSLLKTTLENLCK